MQKLLSMCPKGEMEKCVCAGDDEEVMEWPFEMKKLFFECQPVKVEYRKASLVLYRNTHYPTDL